MEESDFQVTSIDEFLEKYKLLNKIYNDAQTLYLTEQITDNLKYIECLHRATNIIRFLDNVNPFVIQRHKKEIIDVYCINAELMNRTVIKNDRKEQFNQDELNRLTISIAHCKKVLSLEPFNTKAMDILKLSYMVLTVYNSNSEENITLLKQVELFDPCDFQLQYNLGFMHCRANELEKSIPYYKMAISIIDLQIKIKELEKADEDGITMLKQYKVKCLTGLGGIYYAAQDRDLASYYFEIALKVEPENSDVHNHLGVIYTEYRNTEKAIYHYTEGIKYADKSHISPDKIMLKASMHMNMGLAKCYECDFVAAIDCYNKALKYQPRLALAYQNKLMDSNYISHLIDDPMYIPNLHKSLNKIYPLVIDDYRISCPKYIIKNEFLKLQKSEIKSKLKIGFISGDFICHPVAYFVHSILGHINYDLFDIYCYSVKVVQLKDMFPKCNWRVIKNTSPIELKEIIQKDNIDILFDLSAQTGDNRLDTFVLKPAPIQITYCGYPNSSGIRSMDYRLTDNFCDSDKSQRYYQEKLIFMKNCFLAYTPSTGSVNKMPELSIQPCKKNGYITFGCFNRFNKINDLVISTWESILEAIPNARFVIKTREFQTPKIRQKFFNAFKNQEIIKRIEILEYADTYLDHLPNYNKIDITLDTFPYAGTTTSCESLGMGCPILTLFDNIKHYHSQNVTSSLLINSDLKEYIAYSREEYIQKAIDFANNITDLHNLKEIVRYKFANGKVCNYSEFVADFEDTLLDIYKNHDWKVKIN